VLLTNNRWKIEKTRRAITAVALFSCLFVFVPNMAFGQDSLQTVGTVRDSTIPSINVAPVTGRSLLPPEKAKPREINVNIWGTAGGSLTGRFGEINVAVNKNLFSVHYLEYEKWRDFSFDYTYEKPEPVYKESGLFYGRILTNNKSILYCSVSTGISRIVVKDWEVALVEQRDSWLSGSYTYIEYSDYEHTIIGLPVKCKIMLRARSVGIGLDLMANINPNAYSTAAALHLSFGKLK